MGYTPHVLVIGGGAVGTGIARDLAIRGLDVTLVERGTLASGTTGQSNAILDSGARIAAEDPDTARQCMAENRTLFEIARHCIDDTGGLLVQRAGDDAPETDLAEILEKCSIPAKQLTGEDARDVEPALAETVESAIRVPDAVIDPFRLTVGNARDAHAYGADIRTHTEVIDIFVEDGTVDGVKLRHDPTPDGPEPVPADGQGGEDGTEAAEDVPDGESHPDDSEDDRDDDGGESDDGKKDNEQAEDDSDPNPPSEPPEPPGHPPGHNPETAAAVAGQTTTGTIPGTTGSDDKPAPEETIEELDVDYVVNAAEPWADLVTAMADISLSLSRTSRPAFVTTEQPTGTVVTSTSPDGVASITPYGTHSVLAGLRETDRKDETRRADRSQDADRLQATAEEIVSFEGNEGLRSFERMEYAHPRTDREAANVHGFRQIDHSDHHDVWGLTTVLGGRVTTHRLVAERVVDDVCGKFGIARECQTAELPLPGSDTEEGSLPTGEYEHLPGGSLGHLDDETDDSPIICECQSISRAMASNALEDETGAESVLDEIRIRTGATMGDCQGGRCAHRLAAQLPESYEVSTVDEALHDLLANRWAGQRHTLRGEQLRNAARMYRLHAATMARSYPQPAELSLADYDDGPAGAPSQARQGDGWAIDPTRTSLRGGEDD